MLNHFLVIILLIAFTSCSTSEKKEKLIAKTELYYNHGTSKLIKKQYTEALDLLLKAHKLNPESSKINNNLGMAYYFKGKPEKAVSFIKKAIEIRPKNSDAKINLASIFYSLGKYGKAKQLYREVLQDLVYRHQYRTYYNLALISLKEGNSNQAINSLKQSIKDRTDYCPSFFKLGEIYRLNGNYNKALNYFKKSSMGDCINNPAPIYEQAVTIEKMGNKEKARNKYEEVIEKYSKSYYANLSRLKIRNLPKTKKNEPLVLRARKTPVDQLELEDLEEFETPEF